MLLLACLHAPIVAEEQQTDGGGAFRIAAILQHEQAFDEAHDVELLGDLAFVPGKGGSLAIVDVADPERPRLLWHRHDPAALPDAETVLPAEGRLYLGTEDFHSLDITDPRAPKFEAVVSDREKVRRINGMARRGDLLFAANKLGWIDVFDVSNPRKPRLAEAVDARGRFKLHSPHDLDLFDAYVVVCDPAGFGREGKPGRLAVIRAFDRRGELAPAAKWELTGSVASRELSGANRVQVRGRHAFVGGSVSPRSPGGLKPHGVVVDLTNPAEPRQAAVVPFPDVRGPNGLAVAGDVWFLAGGQTIVACDISTPETPKVLAAFTSPEAFPTADDNAHDLVYRDGYLFVSGQGDNRFLVLRVTDEAIRRLAEAEPGGK